MDNICDDEKWYLVSAKKLLSMVKWNTELKNKNLKKEKYMSEEIIKVLDALAEKFGLAVDGHRQM